MYRDDCQLFRYPKIITVSSCCGVCVVFKIPSNMLYLPGLKHYSFFWNSKNILSTVFFLTCVFFPKNEQRVKIQGCEHIPTIMFLNIIFEHVWYSIYSRMTIYLSIDLSIYLSIYLYICAYIHIWSYMYMYIHICMCIYYVSRTQPSKWLGLDGCSLKKWRTSS